MTSEAPEDASTPPPPTVALRRQWTDRFSMMRPYLRGLRDRDLQLRIQRLALGYLDGRSDLIDHLRPGRPVPPSMSHHDEAARLHARACDELLSGRLPGLAPPTFGDLLAECFRQLDLGRVRAVLVGGPAGDVAQSIAGSLAAEHGAVLLGTPEPGTVERLLRHGEQVVVASPFDRSADRDGLRRAALRTSSDIIELRCDGRPSLASDRADPWPEATLLPADDPLQDALHRAATACSWSRR